jgi:hypothetical protein
MEADCMTDRLTTRFSRLFLLVVLLALLAPVANAQFPPVRFAGGSGAPAGTACDASGELGALYKQTGDPATVVNQWWECRQTGASTYEWHPIDHFIGATLPTTCTGGQIAIDTDATSGRRLYACETSTWVLQGDGTGGTPSWEALVNTADTATTYTSNNTSETATFSFESNFGASQQFLIRQQTGNPTAGTLLDVRAADAQVTVFRAGDGTNGITVSQAGALTAEGTGAITATLGDTATAFFASGQIEAARGGTGDDTSGTTGVPRIASGNWTYDAGISHLAASTSADLAGVLSNETGTSLAVFNTDPSIVGPVIGNLAEATCDSTAAMRGKVTVVQGGAGVPDTLRACLKNDADVYAWRPII